MIEQNFHITIVGRFKPDRYNWNKFKLVDSDPIQGLVTIEPLRKMSLKRFLNAFNRFLQGVDIKAKRMLYITTKYKDQCNFDLSKDEVSLINDAELSIKFTCYE